MIFIEPTIFSDTALSLNTNKSINIIITKATSHISTSHFKSNHANCGKYLTEATLHISISHFKRNYANWGKYLTEAT